MKTVPPALRKIQITNCEIALFQRFFRVICGILLVFTGFLLPQTAPAQSLQSLFRDNPDIPWEIKAEEVEYDPQTETYIARNGVNISKEGRSINADIVRFDYKNMRAVAEGHVLMSAGGDTVTGRRIEIDLKNETGILYDSTIFIRESHFYIRGEKIEKVDKDQYLAHKASLTACDGDRPAWRITGQKLDVTIEGYGTVQNAAMWVKGVPVMYLPWFFFPVKQKRQSGLLVPEFANSDRRGFEYAQPAYAVINDRMDATLYNHYMSKRGNKVGAEFRYVVDEKSKGTVMYDFLDDRQVDDGTGTSSKDYGYTGDGELRPNTDRYWFRMKADQALPGGLSSRLDLDIVSDQDYLYEFKRGYAGFEQTKSSFDKNFGRELDEYDDPVRTNRLSLYKVQPDYSINAELLWYDNVINRRWKDEDTTLSQLPLVRFNTSRLPVYDTSFYWNMDAEYTYFYRKDGSRSHRADVYPRIYRPIRFGSYFFAEPSAGFRQTLWYIDESDPDDADRERTPHREMPDLRLDLYTRLFKTWDTGDNSADSFLPSGIQHTLRPLISWEYVPDTDQDDYPLFDSLDRIEKRNRITLSMVNTLTSRHSAPTGNSGEAAGDLYHQLCRFELSQSYDLDTYTPPDPELENYLLSDHTTPESGKNFSPLYGRVQFTPIRYLSLLADAEWSHAQSSFSSRNLGISLWDSLGNRMYVEHRYTRDLTESLYTRLTLNLTRFVSGLGTYGEYERNLQDDTDIRSALGFAYAASCWSANAQYTKEADDHSWEFMVRLHGLGGFGSR